MPPAKLSESHRRIIVQMVASGKTETVIAESTELGLANKRAVVVAIACELVGVLEED